MVRARARASRATRRRGPVAGRRELASPRLDPRQLTRGTRSILVTRQTDGHGLRPQRPRHRAAWTVADRSWTSWCFRPSRCTPSSGGLATRPAGRTTLPPVVEELKAAARSAGCGTCSCPTVSGLSVLDYAPLAELTGWSPELAPEALNCAAPDTGNMEVLHLVGTDEQKQRWLEPLLAGEIRSGFAMTEPEVASSDATQHPHLDRPRRRRLRHQRPQVVDDRRRRPAVRGAHRDGPDRPRRRRLPAAVDGAGADGHRRASSWSGRCRCSATTTSTATARSSSPTSGCRRRNLLGDEGDGFAIAQARLGPGRVHHCMRAIGMAERALSTDGRSARAAASPSAVRSPSRAWSQRRSPRRAWRSSRRGCWCSRPPG